MHDMRITLNHHLLGNFYAADFCDAADIIAPQVDEHQMLRQLFGVAAQFLFKFAITFGRRSAFARAGDRPHGDFVALLPHQYLR